MSETKTKNLCTVPAADLTDSQYFIAEDGGELKRIPKAQVVLKKLEKMLATDTENLAGGGEVTAQELLDALAEQVANKLLAKSQVVNNLLATVEGNPLDATQGKALKELIDTTNNNLSNANSQITQLYSDMSNYRAIIVNDTPADDIPSLLKAKAKLISNQNKGDGFYVIIGGWQGKTYGFSIGNVIGGKITIACFLNNNCYLATCDYSNPESNFSYATINPDLSPYITKSQLFAAQSQSFLVNKSTTIDGTLFSTANFKAQRPNNGTGAASYGFENIGINSGALYLDPTDYKLHFINYEGKDFTINWTKN